MITFGLIEFSMVYQSSSTGAGAARSAARTASAEAKLPTYATDAAAAAATALKTITADEPVEMWVYRANNLGYPGADRQHEFHHLRDELHQVPVAPRNQGVRHRQPDRQRLALLGRTKPATSRSGIRSASTSS